MIEIKDIISRFTLKLSPERKINLLLKNYFKNKEIPYEGVTITLSQKKLTIKGEGYLNSYITIHNKEILSFLHKEAPTIPITIVR